MTHAEMVLAEAWKRTPTREPGKCWEWSGYKQRGGYGAFWIGRRRYRAHRAVYEAINGVTLPRDTFVCHTCDNPSCVNPAHLWAGSRSDNVQDSILKRRASMGEKCSWTKLSYLRVAWARHLHRELKVPIHILAGEFGVDRATMKDAITGETWKVCDEPPIRALLPESSGISGELPAEPAAKCGMGLTLVFVGTNGELPPQELHPVAKCATCGAQHPAHHSCTPAMDPPKCATCGSKGKVVDTVQATHVSGRGHENLITYQPCPACAVGGGK